MVKGAESRYDVRASAKDLGLICSDNPCDFFVGFRQRSRRPPGSDLTKRKMISFGGDPSKNDKVRIRRPISDYVVRVAGKFDTAFDKATCACEHISSDGQCVSDCPRQR